MEVVALYPSIPLEDGISAVREMLQQHGEGIDMLGRTGDEIVRLIRLVLKNNYFRFDGTVYRQRQGVAMGNHLALPFAIIFMGRLEKRMLQTAERRPEFYYRFVDDCLLAWTHGKENLEKFLKHCNEQHPSIRFTWETSLGTSDVNYMDMRVRVQDDWQIEIELYQKPSESGVNLNFYSAIPKATKESVATQQFRRAISLSSNERMEEKSVAKIRNLLANNAYPPEVISESFRRAKKTRTRKEDGEMPPAAILCLPFRSDEGCEFV